MGILAMRSGKRGVFSRTDFFFFFLLAVRAPLQKVGCGGSRYGVIAQRMETCMHTYEFREKTQSPRCAQPAVRISWESRAMYHGRVHSAAGSIVAEGAGAWISGADCSSTTTRGKASAWQQVERHNDRTHSMPAAAAAAAAAAGRSWRGQTWVYASWSFLCFGNIAGRRVKSSLSDGYS